MFLLGLRPACWLVAACSFCVPVQPWGSPRLVLRMALACLQVWFGQSSGVVWPVFLRRGLALEEVINPFLRMALACSSVCVQPFLGSLVPFLFESSACSLVRGECLWGLLKCQGCARVPCRNPCSAPLPVCQKHADEVIHNTLAGYQQHSVVLSTVPCLVINSRLPCYQQCAAWLSTAFCLVVNSALAGYQQCAGILSTVPTIAFPSKF